MSIQYARQEKESHPSYKGWLSFAVQGAPASGAERVDALQSIGDVSVQPALWKRGGRGGAHAEQEIQDVNAVGDVDSVVVVGVGSVFTGGWQTHAEQKVEDVLGIGDIDAGAVVCIAAGKSHRATKEEGVVIYIIPIDDRGAIIYAIDLHIG